MCVLSIHGTAECSGEYELEYIHVIQVMASVWMETAVCTATFIGSHSPLY